MRSSAALLCDMLERTGWNQTEAAERFQIPLSTLNQKIEVCFVYRCAAAGIGWTRAQVAFLGK